MPVFTVEEISIIANANRTANWVLQLCESHEALRKERDDLALKCRKLALDKATIRETVNTVYKED